MTQVASSAKLRANGMVCQDSTNTTIIIEKSLSATEEPKEGMQSRDTSITIEDESPSAAKKLKQARLPFKPLGLKSQLPVNTTLHGVPKKRKLSDQDTPSAKAQKVINKHQLDRLKLDVSDKREATDHDNEVSSSSEAENVPLSAMHKRKTCETNILERFVKPSSQEEISSTIEVVDLTEIDNEETVEITCSEKSKGGHSDESKVDHSEGPKVDHSNESKVDYSEGPKVDHSDESKVDFSEGPKVDHSDESKVDHSEGPKVDHSDESKVDHSEGPKVDHSDESKVDHSEGPKVDHSDESKVDHSEGPKVDHSEVSCSKETKLGKCPGNNVKCSGESGNIVVIEDKCDNSSSSHVAMTKDESDVLTEGETIDVDSKMKKPLPIPVRMGKDEVDKVTITLVTKDISTQPTLSPSAEVLSTRSEGEKEDVFDAKSEESADEKESVDTSEAKSEEIAGKTESVEQLEISENVGNTSCLNSSSSSTDKTESDAEINTSSEENSDYENDESMADLSIGEKNSFAETSISSQSHSPKDSNLTGKDPGLEPKPDADAEVKTSTPNSKRITRPRSLKMSEIKSQEKKQERESMRKRIREQKEDERRNRKEEKEKERLEAKKKREHERMDKELKKKEEKEKKEKDRLEKKKQLENEKIEKTQQKEEERKKKKQELIDAKLGEKRKKDEEKRLRDEEKLREEEEKNKKTMKLKETFSSFFIKKAQQQAAKPKEESSFFMPFQLKKDMTLAPVHREMLAEESRTSLDEHLLKQETERLYVDDVRKQSYQKGKSLRTVVERPLPEMEDDAIDVDEDEDVMCIEDEEGDKSQQTLERHHCKLLQFHTNYRPPYYGTWRKNSKKITPKNPFRQDTELFDYEVDSDDEWEEEEPGESVSSSEEEGEEKEEEVEEEEEDGWMVPHGYLSEDEGCDQDEEITPALLKARQQAKLVAWEADQKKETHRVRATVLGCIWDGEEVMENIAAKLAAFQAVCFSAVPIDLKMVPSDLSLCQGKDGDKSASVKGNRKPVPEEALPDLIRLLHGNVIGMKKLIKEFRLYWKKKTLGTLDTTDANPAVDENVPDKNVSVLDESCTEDKQQTEADQVVGSDHVVGSPEECTSKDGADDCGISKRQLDMKITAIAVRAKRANFKKLCWYVHEQVLKQYGMEDVPLPNAWQYVSKGLVKARSDERCGRKTPITLSESFSDAVPLIMKEESASEEADKSLRKDQPSIMQFTRKMLPSELPKPKIRRIELKSVNPQPLVGSQTKLEPIIDLDSSAPEEILSVYKVLPRDQRSIMDFAQKCANHNQNSSVVKSTVLNHGTPMCTQHRADSKSGTPSTVPLAACVVKPRASAEPTSPPKAATSDTTNATSSIREEQPMEVDDSDCIILD